MKVSKIDVRLTSQHSSTLINFHMFFIPLNQAIT